MRKITHLHSRAGVAHGTLAALDLRLAQTQLPLLLLQRRLPQPPALLVRLRRRVLHANGRRRGLRPPGCLSDADSRHASRHTRTRAAAAAALSRIAVTAPCPAAPSRPLPLPLGRPPLAVVWKFPPPPPPPPPRSSGVKGVCGVMGVRGECVLGGAGRYSSPRLYSRRVSVASALCADCLWITATAGTGVSGSSRGGDFADASSCATRSTQPAKHVQFAVPSPPLCCAGLSSSASSDPVGYRFDTPLAGDCGRWRMVTTP